MSDILVFLAEVMMELETVVMFTSQMPASILSGI